jgi:hypothetical protein
MIERNELAIGVADLAAFVLSTVRYIAFEGAFHG